ncbi:MAG: cysteine peptidase family C39 domain-containing protein [Planctomycetaceae bacterium]
MWNDILCYLILICLWSGPVVVAQERSSGGMSVDAVIQSNEACGRNCLYIALKSLDVEAGSLADLESRIGQPPAGGYSLKRLQEGAESYGMHTLGVQTSVENLALRPRPFACIAHYKTGHFVLLLDAVGKSRGVKVLDPPQSAIDLPRETFESLWSERVLLISPEPLLAEEDLPKPFPWLTVFVGFAILAILASLFYVRRWHLAVAALGCVSLLTAGCGRQPANTTPEDVRPALPAITIEDPRRDLGDVPLTADMPEIVFTIKNRGDAELQLMGIETSCTCVDAVPTRSRIPAGEHAELKLTARLQDPGDGTASVVLRTNDPLQDAVTLSVKWNAIAPLELSSKYLVLGKIKGGETAAQPVSLVVRDPSYSGQVTSVECHPPDVVQAVPVSETEWKIRVLGKGARREQMGSVVFRLQDSWTETLLLTLKWEVDHLIRCTPERAFLDVGFPGSESKKPIRISLDAERMAADPLQVEFITQPPGVTAEVAPPEGGLEQTLTLTWERPEESGVMSGEIQLRGRGLSGDEVVVLLPISGIVRESSPSQ